MPWRGAEYPGEFPTLGYQVADFIHAHCAIPDGNLLGRPFILTDEMLRFFLWFYRLRPDAVADRDRPATGWVYQRGAELVRPQKWGKGPMSAAWVCAEAAGPVLFDGWDANGNPVGRPWPTPWIQITAVSEDQTANVWRALIPMIELGSLRADVPDTGETRVNLPNGGRIEPVTSSGRSRLGQRLTAAVQDELHSWFQSNGGWELADNQRRNLGGMGGRFFGTTNAYDPTKNSVAQRTIDEPGVLIDYPVPPSGSVRNRRERRKVMQAVYGDSARKPADGAWTPWIDLDRIDVEVEALLLHDPPQAERFYLNRSQAGESLAFDLGRWDKLAKPNLGIDELELVVVGVKGARFSDAVAIVVTDVITGHQWPAGIWETPKAAPDDYEHPADAIDGAMSEVAERYEIWRAYCDPHQMEHLVDKWRGRWGEKRIIEWPINRPRAMCYAVRAYREAQTAGDLSHDGDARLAAHIGNARKQETNVKDDKGRPMWSLQKEGPSSPLEIAGAVAGVLSWEARGDAIANNAKKRRRSGKALFL